MRQGVLLFERLPKIMSVFEKNHEITRVNYCPRQCPSTMYLMLLWIVHLHSTKQQNYYTRFPP